MLQQGEVEAALLHAFEKVQSDLEYRSAVEKVDIEASGCTAVCALWKPGSGELWVANCGDSRAVLLAPEPGVIAETADHKPSLKGERARIEKEGGEVQFHQWEDFVECRMFIRGSNPPYPGINMSRSLGDLSIKPHGVIAKPEVVKWQVPENGHLIMASDGLWEFMSTAHVAELASGKLKDGVDQEKVVAELLISARACWAEREGIYCDDITIALASFASQPRRPARFEVGGCLGGIAKLCSRGP